MTLPENTMNQHVPVVAQVHNLLNDSVEQIAQGWIGQLTVLRENTVKLENQLLACVAQTKDNIRKLHELGEQVAAEAARGLEVCEKLSEGVERIAES